MFGLEKCCSCISLEAASIAIAVTHIVGGIYFLVLGFFPLGILYHTITPVFNYSLFSMVIFIGEAFILFVICPLLIVGVKKRMPNYLMPFMIWVCISHFILNTTFFIYSLSLYSIVGPPIEYYDHLISFLYYQNIGKCVVYYVLGAISFIIVFLLFRVFKDEQKTSQLS